MKRVIHSNVYLKFKYTTSKHWDLLINSVLSNSVCHSCGSMLRAGLQTNWASDCNCSSLAFVHVASQLIVSSSLHAAAVNDCWSFFDRMNVRSSLAYRAYYGCSEYIWHLSTFKRSPEKSVRGYTDWNSEPFGRNLSRSFGLQLLYVSSTSWKAGKESPKELVEDPVG